MAKPSNLELAKVAAKGGFSIITGVLVALLSERALVGWLGAGTAAVGGLWVLTGMFTLYTRKAEE